MVGVQTVRAFAPATVANLGAGFDRLGLALDGIGDRVTVRRVAAPGVRVAAVSGDDGRLPRGAGENTAAIAAAAVLERAGVADVGVEIELEKGLPLGSGLGSSGASAAAAACAVNRLLGSPLPALELVEACLDAEERVAGRHADNVAPALLGGLVLVRSTDPLDLVRLPVPAGLTVVVVHPAFELETRRAREVLPQAVSLGTLTRATGNLAGLVAACFSGDLSLLGRCITDEVAAPARAALIPGCTAVIQAALDAGALGSSLSGSGPSVFALCRSEQGARAAAAAMCAAFADAGLHARAFHSPADCPGARCL